MAATAVSPAATRPREIEYASIPLELLRESPTNPRKHFDKNQLQELADSIREKGILQPLLVRPTDHGHGPVGPGQGSVDRFEIVAGERRFKAAKIAGLAEVPELGQFLRDVALSVDATASQWSLGLEKATALEAAAKRLGVDTAKIRRDLTKAAAEKAAKKKATAKKPAAKGKKRTAV